MIPYIGDFAEDATVYHYFNTFSSDDPSASVTITNLADTDIYVYKDGSVTDLVTDGASVVIDFDSRTGVHKLTIDTSVHADYATGSDYMVLVEGTTIDGATVTAGIFTFSIENRTTFPKADYPTNFAAMGIESDGDLTKVNTLDGHTAQTGDTYALANGAAGFVAIDTVVDSILLDTAEIGTAGAGLTNINLPNQTMDIVGDITGNLSGSVGSVTGAVGSVTAEVTADITKISGDATAADNLEASLETMLVGTATGGTTSTVESALTGYGDDTFIGRLLIFRTGTCQYEAGTITDYDSTAGTFTFAASTWTTSPTSETFVIV